MAPWEHGCAGFFPILVCVALLLLVCFLVSRFLCGRFGCGTVGVRGSDSGESARKILDARYAKGEISREEFERMKGEIRHQ